jgi:nucleoside-diphosphate-sugar epimerase
MLQDRGHDVRGIDSQLYEACVFGQPPAPVQAIRKDVRNLDVGDLEGFDAVIHLAAISNDPLGDLRPETTYDINHRASVRVAEIAKAAGVARFLFSSSCSLYGAHGDDMLDESAEFNPVTPYGESKIMTEQDVTGLADDTFSPTFLRNATVYGFSPLLRGDLVVNNLVGYAYTTGEVFLKSDGTPWRPLVHVEDVARAFVAVLEAPREAVHLEAFNVGRTSENYRIRDVAQIVESTVPNSEIAFADTAGPDKRNYRVSCDKIAKALPQFQPQWDVERGARQLFDAYQQYGLTLDDLTGAKLQRIKKVQELQGAGLLDAELRWRIPAVAGSHAR